MTILAISYPSLDDQDYQWIQRIRQQHDILYYDVVAPHFTLVFPTFDVDQDHFARHIREKVQGQKPIAITMRCAIVVKDVLSNYTHTFLVPDQGFSDIVKLHDNFYSGLLADKLRLDIPYIPHISVATSLDPIECKVVADEINRQEVAISGFLRIIDIAQYANRTVTTLEQIVLEQGEEGL
jgi:hypothetical protein